jgi:predicted P-loop ATPase
MDLQHERQITIAIGSSRKATQWTNTVTALGDFYERFKTPLRGTETLTVYLAMKKAQQDELKDVGGFVGGSLSAPRRKAANVTGRDVVTLDFDNIPPYGTDRVKAATNALGCGAMIYSTRKHRAEAPRLRVVIPAGRTMTVEEHEAVARRLAEAIGIAWTDPTTFEASRLMYWPSCSADGEYVYQVYDKPLLDVDLVLGTYADWHDTTSWPQVPGAVSLPKLAAKQGDPESKAGVVGAFCRVYDIFSAMEKYLPNIYEPVDNDPNRYTYLGGSTTGGAVIYDSGKFLFSHHATDPCGGKLVNAFDLVRLHKFADADDEAAPGTPNNRLPSYTAMCELAVADSGVAALMAKERAAEAASDFEDVPATNEDDPANWMQKLRVNPQSGAVLATIDNICIILEHDPHLKNKFALNEFAGRGEVLAPLPWSKDGNRRLWTDTDSNGLYWYMEKVYNITKRGNIDAALDIHSATHSFNEVQNYLKSLVWDGTARLDTLLIDYLGAQDTPYNRAVCRKSFTAAVARAMTPGCKFDQMLILCGPQGIGKSTMLDRMSCGWYNDNLRTFEGKEASEMLQGVWLVEVAELDAFRRTDVARIKQFLSLRSDRYRAAYGHFVQERPRCCVFFGTCNQSDFLQDTTGNRRFWPVDVGELPHPKKVWTDLTPDVVNQIWAEAKVRWQMGESLYLTGELEEAARDRQDAHRETSAREGMILDFVARQVPSDWQKWTLDRRRDYWARGVQGDGLELVDRDRVSAIEVYCELFNGHPKDVDKDTRFINSVLSQLRGWKKQTVRVGADYGPVKGFIHVMRYRP